MNPLFSTGRLHFSRLGAEHAGEHYLRWLRDPEVTKYLTSRRHGWNEDLLREYIVRCNENPSILLVGMFLKAGGRHIGNIKFDPIKWEHGRAIMGFLIGEKDLWGQGYASEGLRGITDYAFRTLRLHKVYASCNSANKGSVGAFIKAGFQCEGARQQHFCCDGVWTEQVLFARFCDENGAPVQPMVFPGMG